MGMAQIPTLAKWGTYLEQCANLQPNPLGEQLVAVLGFLKFTSDKVDVPNIRMDPSLNQIGMISLPLTTWYTDGSCQRVPALWVAVGYQVNSEELWYKQGYRQLGCI
jgi:hypothetical protein